MTLKQLALRHAGVCRECGVELPAKTTAVYDFDAKNVMCLACSDAAHHDAGAAQTADRDDAGIVSRREADRRVGERRRPTESDDRSTTSKPRTFHAPSSLPVG